MNAKRTQRLAWLARVYSGDELAISDETANQQLFDRANDLGLEHFITTYRPLAKMREAHGPLQFDLGVVDHAEPDLSFADLMLDGETVFKLYVRFEAEAPNRIMYWSSYPPLPHGIKLRPYEPRDAAGCVALERACPMEMTDGSRWIIDRGAVFDDYLKLMAPVDAVVATAADRIVGFYSCALRPVCFKGEDTYCVYQHHYRVHPDYRAGSISQGLASFVDPRRTFEAYAAQFPYSLIDPNNLHMRNVGFPEADGVRIARLALPVSVGRGFNDGQALAQPTTEDICDLVNHTHGGRELFRTYDADLLQDRWSRADTFAHANYRKLGSAVLGIWRVNELNIMDHDGHHDELRLSFVMDYGFRETQDLQRLIRLECASLAAGGTTHLCFMCDTRAPEYELLASLAEKVQQFAVHTLPWIIPDLQQKTTFCDGFYC